MENFGFNKIDEDDMFNPKQSTRNMRSLSEIEMIQNDLNETALSDVDINSVSPNVQPTDEMSDEASYSITTGDPTVRTTGEITSSIMTSLSDVSSYIQDTPTTPLPEVPVLENIDTDQSLTVETSKNLHMNRDLTFDLKNQAYTPTPPQRQSRTEATMATTPAVPIDNLDYKLPSALSTDTSASRRANKKGATPEWRSRLG